jgi:NAD(P)-dependent dehydrogenase (short-subunit alcohol dehydrogenase family)
MTAQPLKDVHAFVTGGGTGIGAAIARELARLGARLSLAARREEKLLETCEALRRDIDAEARSYKADVTDAPGVARAIEASVQASGPIGILVNNAGAAESAPFFRSDAALLDRMLAVNLKGAFHCIQAVAPSMLKARAGRIVNVASTAGLTGYAYVAAYCAAKHALVGLTRALAREFAPGAVTVNAVCPGYTETPLLDDALERIHAKTGRSREAARAELAAANPMGRIIRPEEVAASVGWLCLPESGSVTGQAIIIAGGELMA